MQGDRPEPLVTIPNSNGVVLGAMFGMRDAAPSRVAFTNIPDFDKRVN